MLNIFVSSVFLLSFGALASIPEMQLNPKSLSVIDGDSLSLRMRVVGMDAPELGQPCQQVQGERLDCGRLSKAYLQQALKTLPGELRLVPMGKDNYQRILVRVYKGEVNLAQYLVEQGMAFSYRDTYLKEQQQAKAAKRGFWSYHTPPIKAYRWRRQHPRR